MSVLDLFVTVTAVTVSGALSPGPIFFSTILEGTKHGTKAGLVFSITHAFVEFPLVILLASGFVAISQPAIKVVVGISGGLVLLFLGLQQARAALRHSLSSGGQQKSKHTSLFVTGLVLNALNPFFIVWWLTIGAKLVLGALAFGSLGGVLLMYAFHVWIDFVWLSLVSYLAMKGINLLGSRGYRLLLGFFGCALILFGIVFLLEALGAS